MAGELTLGLWPSPWDWVSPLPFTLWGTWNESYSPLSLSFLMCKGGHVSALGTEPGDVCESTSRAERISVLSGNPIPKGKMEAPKPVCGGEGWFCVQIPAPLRETVCPLVFLPLDLAWPPAPCSACRHQWLVLDEVILDEQSLVSELLPPGCLK